MNSYRYSYSAAIALFDAIFDKHPPAATIEERFYVIIDQMEPWAADMARGYASGLLQAAHKLSTLGYLSPDGVVISGYADHDPAGLSVAHMDRHGLCLTTIYLPIVFTWPDGNIYF